MGNGRIIPSVSHAIRMGTLPEPVETRLHKRPGTEVGPKDDGTDPVASIQKNFGMGLSFLSSRGKLNGQRVPIWIHGPDPLDTRVIAIP